MTTKIKEAFEAALVGLQDDPRTICPYNDVAIEKLDEILPELEKLDRIYEAAPALLALVQQILQDGQFFITAVEAKDPFTSNFIQWEKDAKAIIKNLILTNPP